MGFIFLGRWFSGEERFRFVSMPVCPARQLQKDSHSTAYCRSQKAI